MNYSQDNCGNFFQSGKSVQETANWIADNPELSLAQGWLILDAVWVIRTKTWFSLDNRRLRALKLAQIKER